MEDYSEMYVAVIFTDDNYFIFSGRNLESFRPIEEKFELRTYNSQLDP